MTINITYPQLAKKRLKRQHNMTRIKWLFLGAAALCALLNLLIGGQPWSVIVLWALWTIWSFLVWPDLIECNRISLWIRLVVSAAVLLQIIAVLFAPNAAAQGVPLVWLIGITGAGVLFFTDLERQQQNMLPMLLLIAVCLAASLYGLLRGRMTWELMAMGAFALAILIACLAVMRNGFAREIKKRFHRR